MSNESVYNLKIWLSLQQLQGVGPVTMNQLAKKHSSLQELIDSNVEIIQEAKNYLQQHSSKIDAIISDCQEHEITIITVFDTQYPATLKRITDAPPVIFAKGNTSLLSQKSIAIIGSRSANQQAVRQANHIATEVNEQGYIIVSGGALGIDTAAHLGASDHRTIVVLGTGILHQYPNENKELFEQIVQNGGLIISENHPRFTGDKYSFLSRNRITSGLSEAVVVCALQQEVSGTMQQCRIADKQKKRLFYPPSTKQRLVSTLDATAITTGKDVVQELQSTPQMTLV